MNIRYLPHQHIYAWLGCVTLKSCTSPACISLLEWKLFRTTEELLSVDVLLHRKDPEETAAFWCWKVKIRTENPSENRTGNYGRVSDWSRRAWVTCRQTPLFEAGWSRSDPSKDFWADAAELWSESGGGGSDEENISWTALKVRRSCSRFTAATLAQRSSAFIHLPPESSLHYPELWAEIYIRVFLNLHWIRS